ncbi:MAG: hypothetical protein WC897_01760 [Candidatus Gracilibacteria bacterium]
MRIFEKELTTVSAREIMDVRRIFEPEGVILDKELGGPANFVVIDGLAIELDDLLLAIIGNLVRPVLTDAEILAKVIPDLGSETHKPRVLYEVYASSPGAEYRDDARKDVAKKIEATRAKKLKKIQKLISKSTKSGSLALPNRAQILLALGRGELMYNSLTEFLSKFAQLNQIGVEAVGGAVREVLGDEHSSESASYGSGGLDLIGRFTDDRWVVMTEELLGLDSDTLKGRVPVMVLQRSLLDQPMGSDITKQLVATRGDMVSVNIPFGVDITVPFMVSVLSAASIIPALAVLGMNNGVVINSILDVGLPLLVAGGTAKAIISKTTGWLPTEHFLRHLAVNRATQPFVNQYMKAYQVLAEKVSTLQTSNLGKLKLALLRELWCPITSDSIGFVKRLKTLIDEFFGDAELLEKFNTFCGGRTGDDFSNSVNVEKLLGDFGVYQSATGQFDGEFDLVGLGTVARVDQEADDFHERARMAINAQKKRQ